MLRNTVRFDVGGDGDDAVLRNIVRFDVGGDGDDAGDNRDSSRAPIFL